MERKLPKNIRQIGNVSDNPKIYVEDYVDTFLNQLEEKAKDMILGAFLIGETFRKDDQDYVFISGSIQMEGLDWQQKDVGIGDKIWKKGCEECKRYFSGSTIVGWVLVGQNVPLELNSNLIKMHEKTFMRKTRVLVMRDTMEKKEVYYVYKYNDLMKISGHYIYYEKNPCMQDYMISKRKQNCVTPSEDYEDRATKDFRSIIREKESGVGKKKARSNRYAMNVAMILLVIIAGAMYLEHNEEGQQEEVPTGNTLVEIVEEDVITSEQVENEEMMVEIVNQDSEAAETEFVEELVDGEDVLILQEVEVSQGDESVNGIVDERTYQSGDVYEVADGDTLAKISILVYGTMGYVDEICDVNGLLDSDYIYIGQKLLLP